ncbi:MAG: undecaprenyl-diphosphatase [Microgenomates group bacterium Gr01-1014_5]|nr:MAG: undecaprenyl-diphosphatase [Microgenomates group bacterium Gr01-1014_5]
MDLFSAALLGIVQGLTEFLPISSSAHLVIVQKLLPNFSQPGILFDVALHGGTLLAVLIYYRRTVWELLTFKNPHLMWLLIIGTIPAGLAGYFLNDLFESMFASLFWVGITLMISGVMNWFVDSEQRIVHSVQGKQISFPKALIVGIFQAVAIVPGISRSSATIFSGTMLGIDKKQAADFSFLLSIPAILGAVVLQLTKHGAAVSDPAPYIVGFILSGIVGYFSIGWLLSLLAQNKYKYFAVYCLIVGALVSGIEIL